MLRVAHTVPDHADGYLRPIRNRHFLAALTEKHEVELRPVADGKPRDLVLVHGPTWPDGVALPDPCIYWDQRAAPVFVAGPSAARIRDPAARVILKTSAFAHDWDSSEARVDCNNLGSGTVHELLFQSEGLGSRPAKFAPCPEHAKVVPFTTYPFAGFGGHDYLGKTPPDDSNRCFDVAFVGEVSGNWPQATRYHRGLLVETLGKIGRSLKTVVAHTSKGFTPWEHANILRRTKVAVSPFGNTEISLRDWEAVACGCALLKPRVIGADLSTDYLLTINPFMCAEAMVYCDALWRDLPEAIEEALDQFDDPQRERLAEAARMRKRLADPWLLAADFAEACRMAAEATP